MLPSNAKRRDECRGTQMLVPSESDTGAVSGLFSVPAHWRTSTPILQSKLEHGFDSSPSRKGEKDTRFCLLQRYTQLTLRHVGGGFPLPIMQLLLTIACIALFAALLVPAALRLKLQSAPLPSRRRSVSFVTPSSSHHGTNNTIHRTARRSGLGSDHRLDRLF